MKTVFARSGGYPHGRAPVGVLAPVVPPVAGNPGSESGQAPPPSATGNRRSSFTLTEMLVVTLIVALLAGMVLGLAGYVQGRQARSQVRAQMAMIEAACEGFRADTGHYPTSTPARVTLYWKYGSHWFPIQIAEVENAGLLFQQLMGGGYIDASSFRVKSEPAASTWVKTCNISSNGGWVATSRTEAIIDPWGKFYNYYCVYPRPATVGTTETVSGSCVYLCQANISGVVVWVTCNVSYTHLRSNGPQVNLTFDLWSSGPDGLNNQGGGDDIANFVR